MPPEITPLKTHAYLLPISSNVSYIQTTVCIVLKKTVVSVRNICYMDSLANLKSVPIEVHMELGPPVGREWKGGKTKRKEKEKQRGEYSFQLVPAFNKNNGTTKLMENNMW